MIYAIVRDGIIEKCPYTIDDLRKDNPNVSFPSSLSDDLLSEYNLYPYVQQSAPFYNHLSYRLGQSEPIFDGTKVVIGWEIIPRPDAEIRVRSLRDKLLAQSDWTQMPDSPLSDEKKTEWATYRQTLRDLTEAPGFPLAMVIPDTPR